MKKTKIIITIILSILLVAIIVRAGLVANSLKNAEIKPKEPIVPTNRTHKNITFICDKIPMSVMSHEPDGKWDDNDIEYAVLSKCKETATEIRMDGLILKELSNGKFRFMPEFVEEDLGIEE